MARKLCLVVFVQVQHPTRLRWLPRGKYGTNNSAPSLTLAIDELFHLFESSVVNVSNTASDFAERLEIDSRLDGNAAPGQSRRLGLLQLASQLRRQLNTSVLL